MRIFYLAGGLVAVGLAALGAFLPILPTVPFLLLAAFCFARSNRAWERRILDHPVYGPHIRAWRARGAISRRGKAAATGSLVVSAALGLWLVAGWPRYIPVVAALLVGGYILTRPTARPEDGA